jgi:hypothetical protein
MGFPFALTGLLLLSGTALLFSGIRDNNRFHNAAIDQIAWKKNSTRRDPLGAWKMRLGGMCIALSGYSLIWFAFH